MRWRFSVPFQVSILALLAASGCGGTVNGGGNGNESGSSTTVTIAFSTAGAMPSVVAARIGSGAFTPAALSSNVLTLSVPEGTTDFAVAYRCPAYSTISLSQNDQYVIESSTTDGTSLTGACPSTTASVDPSAETLAVNVDASAITGANAVQISATNGSATTAWLWSLSMNGPRTLSFVPAGVDTVLVGASSGTLFSGNLLAAKRFDSQTVPGLLNGGNVVTIGAADATTAEPITYQNLPTGYTPMVSTQLLLSGGGLLTLSSSANGTLASYPKLPSAAIKSGDAYELIASAAVTGSMVAESVVTNGEAAAVNYPSPWDYSGPTAAALPTIDFSSYSGFTSKSGLMYLADFRWNSASLVLNHFNLIATAGAMHGPTDLAMPDLSSAAAGFLAPPASGVSVNWTAEIEENSAGALGTPSAGVTVALVGRSGAYTVP